VYILQYLNYLPIDSNILLFDRFVDTLLVLVYKKLVKANEIVVNRLLLQQSIEDICVIYSNPIIVA